jgi:hypothetical protein
MTIGSLHDNPPSCRIRRSAQRPKAALAKIQQCVSDVLFLEVRLQLIERVSLPNSTEIDSHTRAQHNGAIGEESDFVTPHGSSCSLEFLVGESRLTESRVPPDHQEWTDGNVKCSLRELRVAQRESEQVADLLGNENWAFSCLDVQATDGTVWVVGGEEFI